MSLRNTFWSFGMAALLVTGSLRAEKIRNHFDSDAAGRPPGFFEAAVWGSPGEARWLVLADVNTPSAPNKLIQTVATRRPESIAVALRRTYTLLDGQVALGLRKGAGQGGLVFRAAGEKDFLLLIVDLVSGDARLLSYRAGKPTELARGKAPIDREWSTVSVAASGSAITARWNGAPLLEATDPRPVAGRLGAATIGPGSVSFDEFVFESAPEASK